VEIIADRDDQPASALMPDRALLVTDVPIAYAASTIVVSSRCT
jgi:hypothetical protein